MDRSLQAIGLFLMLLGMSGMVLAGGAGQLMALADPCLPNQGTPPPKGIESMQALAVTPRPSQAPAKQLESYPVFAPSESLGTATPSPTPSPEPEQASPEPSASPSGKATLQPCPTNRHHLFGEGPIEFSGTGGVDLGAHRSSAFNYSQQQNEANLSLALHAGRRTERTSLNLDESLGANTGASASGTLALSQLNLSYNTPQYSLGYGIISPPTDTQLSNATFNRGLTLGVPLRRDQVDLVLGRAPGTSGETYGVLGLRHSGAYSRGLLFSQTLYLARGDTSGARNTTFDLSLGRYKSGATYRAEVAASNTRGVAGVPDGTRMAYALHADFLGSRTTTSIGYFTIPEGYLTLGEAFASQKNFSFTNRRSLFHRGQLTFDYGDLLTTSNGESSRAQHETFNLSLPFGQVVSSQSLLNFSQSDSGGQTLKERDAGLTLSESIASFGLTQTVQTSQQTANDGSTIGQSQMAFGLTHAILRGFLSLESARTRIFGQGAGGGQTQNSASIEEPIGRKAQIGYAIESLRVDLGSASTQATNQFTQTFSLTRRLSPVVAVRATLSATKQNGTFGGTARAFNFDIVGPLAFGGAARYSGRINPNLPAIVQGHVYLQNEASAYGLVGNTGIANVLITLDGGLTQRTDATGSFEFRFVRPGVHNVTISSGTLPPGVIPDSATQSFTIQGGQIFNVDFSAGMFAGVQGVVTVQRGQTSIPVGGVQLIVDDKQRGYTASNGSYQIGHLSPGRHTIAIVLESLPSNLTAPGTAKKEVTVSTGTLSTVDWVLAGLGSIEGEVLYTADAGFGDIIGAKDVYVVAEPGEHAAISDETGHFIIDNLPVGQYTLSVDEDSLPDGESVAQGPDGPVTMTGGEAVQGITFKVGPKAKAVIMTFSGGPSAAVQANFVPDQVPPGGITELVVTTSAKSVRSVTASGDLGSFPLHYVPARKAWIARLRAPSLQNGDYTTHVDVEGSTSGGGDASVTISNAIRLVVAHGVPSHPRPGETVRVIAKIVADVEEGDLVALEGGEQIKLPKPHGSVFSFTIRAPHALPVRGIIFTKRGERIPFVIEQ